MPYDAPEDKRLPMQIIEEVKGSEELLLGSPSFLRGKNLVHRQPQSTRHNLLSQSLPKRLEIGGSNYLRRFSAQTQKIRPRSNCMIQEI